MHAVFCAQRLGTYQVWSNKCELATNTRQCVSTIYNSGAAGGGAGTAAAAAAACCRIAASFTA